MSEEKNKWGCNCQEYLKTELKNLKPWQLNAKKKIEELLAYEQCPYKQTKYCNTDYTVDIGTRNKRELLKSAGGYIRCNKCDKSFRTNCEWIDKSGDYYEVDYFREKHHAEECEAENQIKSNQIKSNQIKSNQIKSNQTQLGSDLGSNSQKTNYLPYILGGVGIVALIGGLIWYFTRKWGSEEE